jgi:hypothetical protein
MAGDARLIPAGCPAAIAIHYNRDMNGEPAGIDLAEKKLIARPVLYYFDEFIKDILAHYPRSHRLRAS